MSKHVLWIFDAKGKLWDRFGGDEADLREQGINLTTQRGQLRWVCHLRTLGGDTVAECKRGIWKDATT